jgi:hypothetical protein
MSDGIDDDNDGKMNKSLRFTLYDVNHRKLYPPAIVVDQVVLVFLIAMVVVIVISIRT